MEPIGRRPHEEAHLEKAPNADPNLNAKEVRVEVRTNTERIEGYIRIPSEAQSYCKRLSDILWYADRGGTGILTLAGASIYDLKTSKLMTRQKLLGVAKSQVVYFWLLPYDGEGEQPQVVELTERG